MSQHTDIQRDTFDVLSTFKPNKTELTNVGLPFSVVARPDSDDMYIV